MNNRESINIRKSDKRKRDQFYRLKKGLFKGGTRIHHKCQAEVYILVRRNGRSYIFSSNRATKVPFSEQMLVRRVILAYRSCVSHYTGSELPTTSMVLPRRRAGHCFHE